MAAEHVLKTVVEVAGSVSPSLGKSVNNALGQMKKFNLSAVAKFSAVAVAAAAVVKVVYEIGKAAVTTANEYQQAMKTVSTATGATGKDLEALGEIVKEVYSDNFGDSMADAAEAVSEINKMLGLQGDELKSAAENALTLSKSFEFDLTESTRAVSALMKNFGVTAEEAYNIIAYGAQNGANQNGDMLDVLNEYATQYAALGLSAEEFVENLVRAGDEGVFSMDKVGDAVKEFNIRSKDLSNTSAEAYRLLGLDANEMFSRFAAGGETAREAFFEVIDALNNMDDPLAANTAAVNLFGTQYEDLGKTVLPVLQEIENATLDDVDAMGQLTEASQGDLATRLQGLWRKIETALIPLGETLIGAFEQLMPALESTVTAIVPIITEVADILAPIITDVVEMLGPALTDISKPLLQIAQLLLKSVLPPIVKVLGALMPPLVKILNVLMKILEPILEVVGWLLEPIADIISFILDLISLALDPLSDSLDGMGAQFKWLFNIIKGVLDPIMTMWNNVFGGIIDFLKNVFTGDWKAAWGSVGNIFRSIWDGIVGYFKGIVNGVISLVEGMINGIINAINAITGGLSNAWTWLGIPEIPEIQPVSWPRLASGGWTDGVSIAGEAGREAVISLDPAYRAQNIDLWTQAGQELGVVSDTPLSKAGELAAMDDFSLGTLTDTTIVYYDFSGFTWAPQVNAADGGNAVDIMAALRDKASEFFEWLEDWVKIRERGRYDTCTVY